MSYRDQVDANPFEPGDYSHQVFDACQAAGLNRADTLTVLLDNDIARRGAEAAVARAREVATIRALCVFAEVPELADEFIGARISEQEARRIIIDARAEAADALPTDGHPPSTPDAGGAVASEVYRQRRGSV